MKLEFGLPQRTIDEIHAIFAKHSKVKKVLIYGSRAMGKYRDGSDIDLTIFGEGLGYDDILHLSGELEDSSIPYLVDLSIFEDLTHAKLKDHINRHGKVFYDRYAGWKTVKLGEVCEVIAGQSPKGENYNKDEIGLPFYQGKKDYGDIYLKKPTVWTTKVTKKSYPNDILMSVRAPVGALNITNQEICIGRGLAAIRVKEKVDRNFIFYTLKNIANDLTGTAGAIFDSINKTQIEEIKFSCPSFPEQQRIVAKLDTVFTEIDTAITANKKKQEEVNKLKQAILTNTLHPPTPTKTWKTVKLGDVIIYEKENGQGACLPYVGMENIRSSSMQLIGEVIIPKKTSSVFKFNEKHVLFGRLRPYLKKILVPTFEGQCSTEIFCIRPFNQLDRKYLAYWLLSPVISQSIDATSTGARMPRANMNAILNFDFTLPPLAKQKQIVAKLDTAFTEIDNFTQATKKKIANHKALKSAILTQELQKNGVELEGE